MKIGPSFFPEEPLKSPSPSAKSKKSAKSAQSKTLSTRAKTHPILKEKSHPHVVVRHSAIAGRGAFAKKNLKKGQVVIEYTGTVRKEVDEDDVRGGDIYLFGLDRGYLIDPSRGGNQARFINHSCEPNCETQKKGKRVFVEAMRPIKKGEELTYDYLMDIGRKPTAQDKKNFPCYCGSAGCRGTLLKISVDKK